MFLNKQKLSMTKEKEETILSSIQKNLEEEFKKRKRVIFSGGGTLGPVMPLIAIYQELFKKFPTQYDFLWVGVKGGPEKEVIEKYGLKFVALPEAKLRRYFSWHNFCDVFNFVIAFFKSWTIIKKFKPDVLISAGGFMSVPLHLSAWLLHKKTIIHQQDVQTGLANKIMSLFASYINVSLNVELKDFPQEKTICLGNPVREGILLGKKEEAITNFLLDPNLPTILVLGGGTGALSLNKIIAEITPRVVERAQIIHMTGKGKEVVIPKKQGLNGDKFLNERYHPVHFLNEKNLADVLALTDIVIARAGFSTLSELAVAGKALIIAPIPNSHQVANAQYFADRSGAKIFFSDRDSSRVLLEEIFHLIDDPRERIFMGRDLQKIMPGNARERMAELVEEVIKIAKK